MITQEVCLDRLFSICSFIIIIFHLKGDNGLDSSREESLLIYLGGQVAFKNKKYIYLGKT